MIEKAVWCEECGLLGVSGFEATIEALIAYHLANNAGHEIQTTMKREGSPFMESDKRKS